MPQITPENDSDGEPELPMTVLNGNECASDFKTNEEMMSEYPNHQNQNPNPNPNPNNIVFDLQGPQQVDDDIIPVARHNQAQEAVLNNFMHLPQHLMWPKTKDVNK